MRSTISRQVNVHLRQCNDSIADAIAAKRPLLNDWLPDVDLLHRPRKYDCRRLDLSRRWHCVTLNRSVLII
jgi:hypothetical protein